MVRHRLGARLVLALGLWLWLAPPAFARTATWDGGGGDNLDSTAANWDSDTLPVAGDDIVFNGTSTTNCNWGNLGLGYNSFSMNAGYTGTVSGGDVLADTITVSSGTLTQAAGGVVGDSGGGSVNTLTINSGATFTAGGSWITDSNSTLTLNGAVTFNGNGSTLSGPTTIGGTMTVVSPLTISFASPTAFTLNSGGTINGAGTVSYSRIVAPTLNGTITMQSGSTFGTFRYTVGTAAVPTLTVPATTYTSHLDLRPANVNATYTIGAGTLSVAGNFRMDHSTAGKTTTVTNATNNTPITVGGNWDDDGTAGSATYTPGTETVTFDGSGATGTITIDTTNITTTWYNVTFNESGTTFNVTGTATVTGALTVGSGTTLDIDGDMTITASGSSIDNSGTIDETEGQLLHPATSLKLTDQDGNEVADYDFGAESVYVTLVDEDENLNGTSADTANGVTVTCGSDSEAMSGSFLLTETGAKTETFRNTTALPTRLLTTSQSPTTNNSKLECRPTDTISVAYTDQEDSTDNTGTDTTTVNPAGVITIGQTLNKTKATPGEPVLVTVTLTNNGADSYTFNVEDSLPAGFAFKEGSAALDGAAVSPSSTGNPLVFSSITTTANQVRTLKYLLTIGSVPPGQYINSLIARQNPVISNLSAVTLTVVPDPLFTLATLLGKVFVDANANGRQDRHEPGLADIRLATEEGVTVTTDTAGRFHLPDLLPGRHLLKLDQTTLPPGATLTTEHTRLITATDGSLSKVNFGVRLPSTTNSVLSPKSEVLSRSPAETDIGHRTFYRLARVGRDAAAGGGAAAVGRERLAGHGAAHPRGPVRGAGDVYHQL
ncbi:MAG: hypothetical protein HY597_06740 [Candidatus Omnitrophica bacterium]|nr:hypothetical protein [Candidatus Omnitrophota bacterium]